MPATVDFYYGIGSRYSYLAATRIAALERDTGAVVRWRPLYSGELMRRRGMDPFQGPPTSGQYDPAYRARDVARWARLYGIPFRDPDWSAHDWQRLALAAVAADRLGRVSDFTLKLYDAIFGAGPPSAGDADLARIAAACGIAAADLRREIDSPETASRHVQTLADALAAGVFGVPTFVTAGELFWGNDRLVLLQAHLRGDG